MGKLHIRYEDKNALLQINDDSLIITNKDEKIKITFDSIKDYSYNDKVLTINKVNGNKIILEEVEADEELFDKLEDYTYIYSNEEDKKEESEAPKKQEENTNVKKSGSGWFSIVIILMVIAGAIPLINYYSKRIDKGVPSNIQGVYEYRSDSKNQIFKQTIDLGDDLADVTTEIVEFTGQKKSTKTYKVKVIEYGSSNNDYIEFDLYLDGKREYNCNTSFGLIYCQDSKGNTREYNKKGA